MNIRLKKKRLPNGVHLPDCKLTAASPIEKAPIPESVILPVQQNLGAPNKALVRRGDKVLTGQKIADSDKYVSAPIHASCSGEVASVTTGINPRTGEVTDIITITSDGADKWIELDVPKNPEAMTNEEILKRVREAGIVGMGGATFPAHVKLAPPKGKTIDTLILNGCESEPYATADHRVMLEYGDKMLGGLQLIQKLLGAKNVYIAVEDNKEDAMDNLENLIGKKGFPFQIVPMEAKYIGGAEKTLIKTIVKREVPIGGLPLDVGVVVHNVATAKAIYDAIYEGKPLIERVVTVTGAVKNPKNLLVRLGTPIKSLIDFCSGMVAEGQVIMGGPMMGVAVFDLNSPVTKGTTCLLVKAPQPIKETNCINCGRCIAVCPAGLMPRVYPRYIKKGQYEDCQSYYIECCFECGMCSYVCPANIPHVQYIKIAKKEISRRKAKK
ncbi:MAG: electron transport complex subunit RsxC [Chloroflexota bacterium]